MLNTVLLLSSGSTITYSHHTHIQGKREDMLLGLIATVLLALIFTGFQWVEYSVSSFTISDGIFGSSFFFGTGYFFLFFHNINNYYSSCNTLSIRTSGRTNTYPSQTFLKRVANPRLEKKVFIMPGHDKNYACALVPNFNHRLYSTMPINVTESTMQFALHPYWVTGFADAESSFSLKVSKKSTSKISWHIIPEFRIELHSRDILLLRKIHSFFSVGTISERKSLNKVVYSVQSYRDIINVIIPHFDNYPLITQKRADYLLFKQAIYLLNAKAKSNIEGFISILSLKASMNSGLSETLKIHFPTLIPVFRPVVSWEGIPDPFWLTGFADGESCFYVKISKKSKGYSSGVQVMIAFSISQHVRDELLLIKFIKYLGCGNIEKVSTRPSGVNFVVYKFSDIFEKIIPFFQSYPLQGIKYMDYWDFCEVAKIMKDKGHLTDEGVKKIKSLKSGMNTGRIHD